MTRQSALSLHHRYGVLLLVGSDATRNSKEYTPVQSLAESAAFSEYKAAEGRFFTS